MLRYRYGFIKTVINVDKTVNIAIVSIMVKLAIQCFVSLLFESCSLRTG
jgi:hypothetical protein